MSGRGPELATVDDALAKAGEGFRLLVIGGEAGIGKTTVLDEGVRRARAAGFRVLFCRAAEAESGMSFAGLGDLLALVEPAELTPLPAPQRRALEIALLREEPTGEPNTQRAIGAALLSLLSALSTQQPVLLALDDVQWLDRASLHVLLFALRRLEEQSVAGLAAVRSDDEDAAADLFSSLPIERTRHLRLGPLSADALYDVLHRGRGRPLTAPLLKSIARACGGNPFFALEIDRALETYGPPESAARLPVPDDLRKLVAQRVGRFPSLTRDALLEVSALAQPNVSIVDPAAVGPALDAGVLAIDSDGRIEFVHPLYGAAVYGAAWAERRRRLHRELAGRVANVEERARHLALSTDEPDQGIAAALDAAADLAHRRGAPEVAAELEERAAQRTPVDSPEQRNERVLRAAQHHFRAGEHERAQLLAEQLLDASPSSAVRAQALHLLGEARATIEPHAATGLLEEALLHVGDDTALEARLQTSLGLVAGAIADADGIERHLDRAVELARAADETALLAEAVALRAVLGILFGRGLDEAALEQALELEDPEREVPFQLRPSLNVAQAYEFAGRPDVALPLLAGLRARIVARGEEADLAIVLEHLAANAWLAGDLEQAERDASDGIRVAALTGQDMLRAGTLTTRAMVRAVRSDLDDAGVDAAEALEISERIGWPWGISQALYNQAFIALSEDDPQEAVRIIKPVIADVEAFGIYEWPVAMAVPDAIEALVATGDRQTAARLITCLSAWGQRFDRPWATASSLRGRALLAAADGQLERASEAATDALSAHERLPMPFELGRTLLVLGRLQRRRGQRRAARDSLLSASDIFQHVGAVGWAGTAQAEARRIGVRRAPAELTASEQQVAELAADGLRNREIASRLFISHRTVEANLARAYRKLGVKSRVGLAATMARREPD